MAIYNNNLSDQYLTDNKTMSPLCDVPLSSMVLLEDIDGANVQCGGQDSNQDNAIRGSRSGISFDRLLNAIGGVHVTQGRFLVMITNHWDNLDEALLHPGQVDKRGKVECATKQQIYDMRRYMFPHSCEDLCTQLVDKFPERSSSAKIQEHLVRHRLHLLKAVNELDDKWNKVDSETSHQIDNERV